MITRFDSFWKRLSEAQRGVLVLDYDGTLAPFVEEPTRAVPYPSLVPPLQALARDPQTRLVIVSGRSIDSLRPLLPLNPLPELWGTHGFERLRPDGSYQTQRNSSQLAKVLDCLEQEFSQEGWLDRCEKKPASFAFHWRGEDPDSQKIHEAKARQIFQKWEGKEGFALFPFNGGIELRLAACTKGRAMQALLDEEEPHVPFAYLGDDHTDEDAFRVLRGRGLPLLVASEERSTAAAGRLSSTAEVESFLQNWLSYLKKAR